MTDEIDVLSKVLEEYKMSARMKNVSQELMQHLADSVFYLLRYSEKYNVPLPKKDELIRMVDKANSIIDQIVPPSIEKELITPKIPTTQNRTQRKIMQNTQLPNRTSFQAISSREFRKEIRDRILKNVHTVMTRHSPTDQFLAYGELRLLLEIADGMTGGLRQQLSKDKRCAKAFDRMAEIRHWDCEGLKEINKRLPT